MKYRLILILFSCFLSAAAWSQTQTPPEHHKEVHPENTLNSHYTARLGWLADAMEKNDTPNLIALQADLLLDIRSAMEHNTGADLRSLEIALNAFEGFSFHSGDAKQRSEHLKLLQEVAPLVR